MIHSGHWFKLAHYSLLLRQDDDVENRNAQRPPPSRRLSAVLRWKRPFLLRRLACILVLVGAGAALACAEEPPRASEADDECFELFGLMYWTHRDEGVYRACRDGSQVKLLVPLKNVDGLAVDKPGGKLYFTTSAYPALTGDKLFRANVNGSEVEELLQGLNFTGDLVLDAQRQKLYISSLADGKIVQCNLDGSECKDWLAGLGNPDEMAIDAKNRKLYWVRSGKIQRADLDAPKVEDVATVNVGMMGLTLDLEKQQLYYATRDFGTIRQIHLDAAGDDQLIGGHPGVDGLAFDPYSRKLYWTEEGKICQANVDGSQVETLVPEKTHRFGSIVVLQPKDLQ